MARPSLYPPSPPVVPADLTRPTADYRTQIVLVLFALILFFLLYFAIMIFAGAFAIWAFFGRALPRTSNLIVFRVVLAVPMALLCIYLLKNLFLRQKPGKTYDIEIHPDEHPKLFDFIERLCDEVGAQYPKSVYVNFEVNAAAMQDVSLWRLIVPSRKSLLIGLGLVNCINLTEFKALLAHEFGHFSQKGMKLGGYVNTALYIVEKIVFGRDFFDRFIDGWCMLAHKFSGPVDVRIYMFAWILSGPAWIFWAILWTLRKLLIGLHMTIFFFNRARSRQAEFNADLVAVSVTGSDAPVHLLFRSAFGDHCLRQALTDLQVAMDHHLYTSDIFYHQSHAATYIRKREKKPALGEPPPLPENPKKSTEVFEAEDDDVAAMWATHPSNFDREENAKAYYIRTDFDERSPWLLFDDVEELRERVTYKFYRFHFKIPKDTDLLDPEEIQAFIDEERAETTYAERYQGLYDCRNLMLEDVYDLAQEGKKLARSTHELAHEHSSNLYNVEVKHRSQLHYGKLKEFNLLRAIVNGWHKARDDEIDFRGEIYDSNDARRLLKKVDKELKTDFEWLKELDKRVFLTYFQMALHLGQDVGEDLFKRYRFHMQLQKVWQELKNQEDPVENAFTFLCNLQTAKLDEDHFQAALKIFRDAHKVLKECLRDSEDMMIPVLKNLPAGQPLREFLLEKDLIEGLTKYERSLNMRWIQKLRGQFAEVKKKADRIHYKSLGGILALQEKIGADCLVRWGTAAPGTKSEERSTKTEA
jgi:Zn-dependent protease with chaperone function